MTSVVAGGAGFIGSHLVDRLVESGQTVVVLDDLTAGSLGNLERAISSGRVTFVYADTSADTPDIERVLRDSGIRAVRTVYDLVTSTSPAGTRALIDLARAFHARFVFASRSKFSASVVPSFSEQFFDNGASHRPAIWSSDKTWIGEYAVAAAVAEYKLDARIVRFFNCYGPRMRPDSGALIPILLEAALKRQPFPIEGNGLQMRSMLFVADAVRLLQMIVGHRTPIARPIDIGSDDERTVLDIARTLAHTVGVDFVPELNSAAGGNVQEGRPNLDLARSVGWTASRRLDEGLPLTHAWFARDMHLFA